MSDLRFGQYRVVSVVGSGALATIYKAVQVPLGRTVSVKALKPEIAPTSSFGLQLDHEASILRDLAHPNVVLLLDAVRSREGGPFLVLEHIEGQSLRQLLAKRKVLAVEVALAIGIGICAALEHVHEQGVVHRDVKPSNVLLTSGGIVKLIDFGISQRTREAHSREGGGAEASTAGERMVREASREAFGTPAYMSPEQILGEASPSGDLFSLGVVLYEMMCGQRPFDTRPSGHFAVRAGRSNDNRGATQRLRREPPVALSERTSRVPRSVSRLVMRLLEKSPSERTASASELIDHLRREFRTLTRDDPASVIRRAMGQDVDRPMRVEGVRASKPKPALTATLGIAGQAIVFVVFAVGVFAIEGGSSARSREGRTARPLELSPDKRGGLRVLATPWAYVLVDGHQVETTPFARPVPLSPGRHRVTLKHPEATSVEREIDIIPNETVTLDITMPIGGTTDAGSSVP